MENPKYDFINRIFKSGESLCKRIYLLNNISNTNLLKEVSKHLVLLDDGGIDVINRHKDDVIEILYELNIRVDVRSEKQLDGAILDNCRYIARYGEFYYITIEVTSIIYEFVKLLLEAYNISLDGFEIKQ